MKTKVLILLAYYLPGRKSGGPIRSISNLVDALGDEFQFRIVTSDRDKDDCSGYPGITPDTWIPLGRAEVMYVSPARLRPSSLLRFLASEPADILYINSFFAARFSILPMLGRAAGFSAQRRVILAPRGEFSRGALHLKPWRKRFYTAFARCLPVYRHVRWHASSEFEKQDILRTFGRRADVRIALPLSAAPPQALHGLSAFKSPGELRVVFLSRIVPKKNLLAAVLMLNAISGNIDFHIYGPAEDPAYWGLCVRQIKSLPENVRVEFRSMVDHEEVAAVFSQYHLFLFPTLGENYGHVIFEALISGCPVLISDQTPWRGLEASGAGWDLPLERPDLFRQALDRCVAMTDEEFRAASLNARSFARAFTGRSSLLLANRNVFV